MGPLLRQIAQLGPVFKGLVDVMGGVVDMVTWLLEQFNRFADWLESVFGINLRRWIGRIIGVVSALGLLAAGIRLVLGFLGPVRSAGGSVRSLWRLVTGIFKQNPVCIENAWGAVEG